MDATGHPSGGDDVQIRTFLIADVRGYTLFTQQHGDETAAKLAAKFADIALEVVERHGGTLLELRGDEALCVFASAREAIRSAVELQDRFVEETIATPELPLTVGIGIDAGEAVRVGDGYRGGALNLAARLCGQAVAGEILASREATHLARAVEGARYVDRGTMTFKNLARPGLGRRDRVDRRRSGRAASPVRREAADITAAPAAVADRGRRARGRRARRPRRSL